jgi:hypothetical protein
MTKETLGKKMLYFVLYKIHSDCDLRLIGLRTGTVGLFVLCSNTISIKQSAFI